MKGKKRGLFEYNIILCKNDGYYILGLKLNPPKLYRADGYAV